MKLSAFTLVLDGQPWIEKHLPIFEQLPLDWQWVIVHGAANNGGSTAWCQPQTGRLSTDGTTEYLASIRNHPRVTVLERELWKSKDQMVNAALDAIKEPGVLMQVDSDEVWKPSQLECLTYIFRDRPQLSSMMFGCRYFVGPDLILQGENCYGDFPNEWLRAWRYDGKQRFFSHEPPVLSPPLMKCSEPFDDVRPMSKAESRRLGLVFDHYAYATEAQAAYKEQFYGYRGAVRQWRALQAHDRFPVPLSRFFPWVSGDQPQVVRI